MPALGSDMDEGTLNEWLVKPGDTVTRGQIVAVVETTKAAVEIECWHDGVVAELLVPVGQTVSVGTPLAMLAESGEEVTAAPPAPQPVAAPAPVAVAPAAVAPTVSAPPAPAVPAPAFAAPAAPGHRRWVSPAARRLAASSGVDLDAVTGTGPQGAVTLSDVEHAATGQPAVTTPTPPAVTVPEPAVTRPAPEAIAKPAATSRTPAERAAEMRKSIAAAMSRSKREIPHYYLAHEIMMHTALSWLAERNSTRSVTERVLPAVLQIKAVALAAQRYAEFNGFWRQDGFEPAEGVHVGVAISLRGGGLVAPAIHDVPKRGLDELMADLTDLVARARAGSLRSSEMSDPTITVTNMGDQGVDAVFGVIYPQQVAIVGFGKPADRVCVIDSGIRVVPTVQATLSGDHRASDGHRGGLFLSAVNELLTDPQLLED
ncbi:pyruvate/2-oxoglutarate dehydrogenase complex, dihydrolipoamide acyltransferase component [Mycolicibacterium chubuense NBB4]|uniref:Dihydrolipoamide acetyltransferase component of pyruvate dehydrogenase complex n=2 Tax=Mycolicibacterium chubuense TaxID=1800 RepID=I4BEW8_MYCCN|nr:pyruvate/2-oxoglutarate dehydrogenase complex, dihydrolipoamide acyltransferase component [Mycolicibacterium chubuense NBB4]